MKFTHSIRWRLQLWLGFLLVCVLTGFGVTAHRLYRSSRFEQIDAELSRRVAALSADIHGPPMMRGEGGGGRPPDRPRPEGHRMPPPDDDFGPGGRRPPRQGGPGGRPGPGGPDGPFGPREFRPSAASATLFAAQETTDFYFVVWSRNGAVLKATTNAPTDLAVPERLRGDTTPHYRSRGAWREIHKFTELGECALVGRSMAPDLAALRRVGWLLLAGGGGVLALGLGGGWWLVGRALKPVHDISTTASRIAEGNLSDRINTADTDNELGRLAALLNATFARLESAFAQQKQFTADAAHELRTPIAVLITEAQTTLSRSRTPEEYRETVQECLAAAQQMRVLTESLLQLARFDAGQEPLEHTTVDLAETVRACLEHVRLLAAQRGLKLQVELAPTRVSGDEVRLRQVATNLLGNAIHYNKEGGEIRVVTRIEGADVVLAVTDTGPGIAPEELERIFERFYRGDKSRTRSGGGGSGSGLGLAISKAIVDAHGGNLRVSSQPGVGSTFTVRLPVLA